MGPSASVSPPLMNEPNGSNAGWAVTSVMSCASAGRHQAGVKQEAAGVCVCSRLEA